MSPALYSISIKSKKIKELKEKKNVPVYLPTYLPILRRKILFFLCFQCLSVYFDIREREREREEEAS